MGDEMTLALESAWAGSVSCVRPMRIVGQSTWAGHLAPACLTPKDPGTLLILAARHQPWVREPVSEAIAPPLIASR